MKDKSALDIKLMFEQACAFVDCAEFTELERNKNTYHNIAYGYVDISLSALACEIFIKSLIICREGTYNHEHKLTELWKIYKGLDSTGSQNIEFSIRRWFNMSDSGMFERMLSDASNAFIEWRYIFDYDSKDKVSINPQFIRGFRYALRKYCYETFISKNNIPDFSVVK